MNTNFSQGKSWILSAISDLKIVISSILYLKLLKKSLNMTKEEFKDLDQLELLLGELKKWT